MQISAIIIDDESKSRKSLLQKLSDYCPEIEIVGEAANGEDGLEIISRLQPQLIFLDIEMPKMNGLQMLEKLNHFEGAIIFTTAYNEYAIRAFKFSAFDYLLKPIDIAELKETIQRLVEKWQNQHIQVADNAGQLQLLINQLKEATNLPKKIAIHTHDALHLYELDEIIRLEANSNYTCIFFINGSKLVASKTLKEFEELLPPKQFFRVHHSSIINLRYVRKFLKSDGGSIEMSDGTLVDISRRKKEDFLEVIRQL